MAKRLPVQGTRFPYFRIRARAELVRARTAVVNAARGLVKSYGLRLPPCGTQQVSRELAAGLCTELREVLEPLLKEIEPLNERIYTISLVREYVAEAHFDSLNALVSFLFTFGLRSFSLVLLYFLFRSGKKSLAFALGLGAATAFIAPFGVASNALLSSATCG